MNSSLLQFLKKNAKEKNNQEIPEAIKLDQELTTFFSGFSFESPEKENLEKYYLGLISNKNYIDFAKNVRNSENSIKVLQSSFVQSQLFRFFLSVALNMVNNTDKVVDVDCVVYCLLLSHNEDFINFSEFFAQLILAADMFFSSLPAFLVNAELIFKGITEYYVDPLTMSDKMKGPIFDLGTRVVVSLIKNGKMENVDQFFTYIFLKMDTCSNDDVCIECILLYAEYSCRNHDFSIPDKVCDHIRINVAETEEEAFIHDNLFEEGPFVEEKIANSETALSRVIPVNFPEIKPALFAAQKVFLCNDAFIVELAKRMAGDATYFWRFFFVGVMLYFKDDLNYVNSEKLKPIERLFDLRMIFDHDGNAFCEIINSVLVTLAVKAHLIEPSIILLKSDCPYEVLQGVDIFHGMFLLTPQWFNKLDEVAPILTELSNLFVRTRAYIVSGQMKQEDARVMMRIRSSILHVFHQLSMHKYDLYESDGFGHLIFPLFFEEKSKSVALSILHQWSSPSPSVSFFNACEEYMNRCLQYPNDLMPLFNEIVLNFNETLINTDADVLADRTFSTVFVQLVDKRFTEQAAEILPFCIFEKDFRNVEAVTKFLDQFFEDGLPLSKLLDITEEYPTFNELVLYPAHILDHLLSLGSDDEEREAIIAKIYSNVALTNYSEEDAEKLKNSPHFRTFYEVTSNNVKGIIPLQYESLDKSKMRRKFMINPTVFQCSLRFNQTLSVSTFVLIRFSIIEHEIEIMIQNGKVFIVLRLQGEKQNTYPTPLTVVPLDWMRFIFRIEKTKISLTIGTQQTFVLQYPEKFVYVPVDLILVSIFPVPIDVSISGSVTKHTNFVKVFNSIEHEETLSFLVATILQDPNNSDLYMSVRTKFLASTEQERIATIKRIIPNEASATFLFSPEVLRSFSRNALEEVISFYISSFTADQLELISKTITIQAMMFNIEQILTKMEESTDDFHLFWDLLFVVTAKLTNQETMKVVSYYAIARNKDYFDFFDRCCYNIPDFVQEFTADMPKKIFLQILVSDGTAEMGCKSVELLHKLSCLSKKPVEIPTSYLLSISAHPHRDAIFQTVVELIQKDLDGNTKFVVDLFPIFALFADEKAASGMRKFIQENANLLVNCTNWCFWILTLAAVDKSPEWASIFSEACRGKNMLQVQIWLTFLMKIIPFFDLNGDEFCANVFRVMLSFPLSPELFTFIFRFVMYDTTKTPHYSSLEIAKFLASGVKTEESFDFVPRAHRFHELVAQAATLLLSIPPETFAQGQSPDPSLVVSNLSIGSLLAGLIADSMPADAAILFEKAYTLSQKIGDNEVQECVTAVGDKLLKNKALRPLFESSDFNNSAIIERLKDMINARYDFLKASSLQTRPLVDFDKFCKMIAEGNTSFAKNVNEMVQEFNNSRTIA